MKVVSIYSGKGGTAKTTISVNAAAYLNSLGYKVCVVDTDPQQSIFDIFGDVEDREFDIYKEIPNGGYDVCLVDHHPTHHAKNLGDYVICPITPSRVDFESYRRSTEYISDTPHCVVVTQYAVRIRDDMKFIINMNKLCNEAGLPMFKIKTRAIWKRTMNDQKTLWNYPTVHGIVPSKVEIQILIDEVIINGLLKQS